MSQSADYVSVDEAAQSLGVSRATMWKWIQRNNIATFRVLGDRRTLIQRSDVTVLSGPQPRKQPVPAVTVNKPETWLDWLPDGIDPPDEQTWITRADLLTTLERDGVKVSPRTLGHWETQGILPRPVRRWRGNAAHALYPPFVHDLIRVVANGECRSRTLPYFQSLAAAWARQ